MRPGLWARLSVAGAGEAGLSAEACRQAEAKVEGKRNTNLPIQEQDVQIVNKYGLHARPAMQLVELANQFSSRIELASGTLTVDAKSIMSVMRLAATQGTTLNIMADGEDADQALASIMKLFADGFGEMDE